MNAGGPSFTVRAGEGSPAVCSRCGRAVLAWLHPYTRNPLELDPATAEAIGAGAKRMRAHVSTCPMARPWGATQGGPHAR